MDETTSQGGSPLRVGLHVELRKPHPCGSRRWVITRIGADIGLRCLGCDRRVMLARSEFNKQLKRLIDEVHQNSEE
ncbi:MAG: DUF951 domain-containing protein [Anaerolineae bacterium]|nr:DUF951 domain-containing protein [Anaerolineae bacterium]